MKKVVNKETVAHMWANQTQGEAKTPTRNMYFSGLAIWSYGSHFCIAKHVTNDKGQKAVLFTNRSYSVTTSQHKSVTSSACNHLDKVYCAYPNDDHDKNFYEWLRQAENAISQSLSAKQKRTELKAFNLLIGINDEVQKYCDFFGLDMQTAAPVLYKALQIKDIDTVIKYNEEKRVIEEQKQALKIKQKKADHKKQLAKFRDFKQGSMYLHNGFDYLRFNTETKRVETSQRVEIPEKIARNFYKQILETLNTGKCVICGNKFMGQFEVKEVNKDFIIVGCHKITIKEIKALVKSQGW